MDGAVPLRSDLLSLALITRSEQNMVRALIAATVFGGLILGGAATANAEPYYRNCDAARDAGAAPVYEDEPGYGPHLDRDGDGVGCE